MPFDYIPGGRAAAIAREHLWRDVTGFLAYHLFLSLPTFIPLRWTHPILPSVGDWSERDARWTFAFEAAAPSSGNEGGGGE